MRSGSSPVRLSGLVFSLLLASCSGANRPGQTGSTSALGAAAQTSESPIEVHAIAERPRLTVVRREGDPLPAVAIAIATDLGPSPTAALSALFEARLVAAGFPVRVHVDRSSFRVERTVSDPSTLSAFFSAVARAMRDPFVSTDPSLPLITRRLAALRRAPLDAPELVAVAACTGQPGIAPGEEVVDPQASSFVTMLEAHRREALHSGRATIAAVGPSSFADLAADALEATEGFPSGAPPSDPFPAADVVSRFVAPPSSDPGLRWGRVTIAARLPDALWAVGLAERISAPGSALRARLAALPDAFRVTEIVGVARPHGGCLSVTLAPEASVPEGRLAASAARAAAIAQHEMRVLRGSSPGPEVALRQILSAADPRDAASRAAFWDLSMPVPSATPRMVTVLGVPARKGVQPVGEGLSSREFSFELERALARTNAPVTESRSRVERGQGELWALLASPCGVGSEGVLDAGSTALGLVSSSLAWGRADGVTVEPWVGPEGVGVLAHSSLRDEREGAAGLGRRVGEALARVFLAGDVTEPALAMGRASMLSHIERSWGRGGLMFDAFSLAMVPERPSWVDPFGSFVRVSSSSLSQVRLRLRDLQDGPLRVAVIANMDAEQAGLVSQEIDRYLVPREGSRPCPVNAPGDGKPSFVGVRLPREVSLGHALIGASVPRVGANGYELALFSALALSGEGGVLESVFPIGSGIRASARVTGTSYAAALVIELRAPADLMDSAIASARSLLARLSSAGFTQPEIDRAGRLALSRDEESRFSPRHRLVSLWSGRDAPLRQTPTAQLLSAFLTQTFPEPQLYIVEGLPEN